MAFGEDNTFFADIDLKHGGYFAVLSIHIRRFFVVFAGQLDNLAAAAPAVGRIVL